MQRSLIERVIELVVWCLLVLVANCMVLLDIMRKFLSHGKEYFESPKWYSMPKFLSDSKFGEHKTAYLENVNLHYVESGSRNKPLMLLVHGFPEFWYSWHYQIEEFQKDYRVVAVDLRGYGLSDKPQDMASYKVSVLVDDLKQLLEHLEVQSCILVGHDWGGAVVFSFADKHPSMVDRLVVMNSGHGKAFKAVLEKNKKQLMASWYMFFFQMPYLPEWYLSRMDFKFMTDAFTGSKMGLRKNKLSPAELDAFKANICQPGMLTATINYYRAVQRLREHMGDIEVPTLLIWGTEDGALTIGIPEAHKTCCHNLTIKYMDGASHWVQQDVPEEVNAAMREFLSQESTGDKDVPLSQPE